jgi:2-desacetyl-2-hydroxyethyl bacteriochlorophyllide A dehydrogenase
MLERRKIWVPEPLVAEAGTDRFDDTLASPTEVLVRNMYSHISAGTELASIAGKESFFTIPDTPGYTAVGKILKTGNAIEHLEEGDMVYTYGPHAEYFKIDVTDRWHGVCVKLPEGIDPALAAFTHMAGIAMTSIRSSMIELGDPVLVTGLGTIGNLAAQLAQLQGGRVIASDVVDSRLEIAQQCGIGATVNPLKTDLGGYVKEATGDNLVSTYIDASGQAKVVEQTLDLVSLYGEVILLGSPRDPFETNLTSHLQHFHNLPWCQTMKGALEFTYPTHGTEFVKHSIERNARIILDLILNEKLIIQPLYSHRISPEEIQGAYDGLREQPETYMGVVIDWNN